MKTFEFKVDRSICEALEDAQLSKASLSDLYAFSLGNQARYSIPDEKIEQLELKVVEANKRYELLKAEVEKVFVGVDKTKASWSLDFNTGIVTVNEA